MPAPAPGPGAIGRAGAVALIASGTVLPLALLGGAVVEFVLKTVNPAGVDVTQPLAYLAPMLGVSWTLAALLVVCAVVCIVIARRLGERWAAAIAWAVLGAQVGVGILEIVLRSAIDALGG